ARLDQSLLDILITHQIYLPTSLLLTSDFNWLGAIRLKKVLLVMKKVPVACSNTTKKCCTYGIREPIEPWFPLDSLFIKSNKMNQKVTPHLRLNRSKSCDTKYVNNFKLPFKSESRLYHSSPNLMNQSSGDLVINQNFSSLLNELTQQRKLILDMEDQTASNLEENISPGYCTLSEDNKILTIIHSNDDGLVHPSNHVNDLETSYHIKSVNMVGNHGNKIDQYLNNQPISIKQFIHLNSSDLLLLLLSPKINNDKNHLQIDWNKIIQKLPKNIESILEYFGSTKQDQFMNIKLVINEIENLTQEINRNSSTRLGFDLCRRGALYRKIGRLQDAKADLLRSIQLESKLSSAHWNIHFIYLLEGKTKEALYHLEQSFIYSILNDSIMEMKIWTKLIDYNPTYELAYEKRANLYLKALFTRGCLLTKACPLQSLRDLTLCIYIGNKKYQTMALIQRGLILYQLKNADEELSSTNTLSDEIEEVQNTIDNLNEYKMALNDFQTVLTYNVDHLYTDVYRLIGLTYIQLNQPNRAIEVYTEGINKQIIPNINILLCRSEAYYQLNQFNKAIFDIQRVIHLSPHLENHYLLFANYLHKLANTQLVQHSIQQYLSLAESEKHKQVEQMRCTKSEKAEIYNHLGQYYMKIGNYLSAIHAFTTFIQYNPHRPHDYHYAIQYGTLYGSIQLYSFINRSIIYMEKYQDYHKAINDLYQAKMIMDKFMNSTHDNENNETTKVISELLIKLMYTIGHIAYANCLMDYEGYNIKMGINHSMKLWNQALSVYEFALKMDELNLEASIGLSMCLQVLGRLNDALKQITHTLNIYYDYQESNSNEFIGKKQTSSSEDHNRLLADAYDCRAIIYLQLGRPQCAIDDLTTAIRLNHYSAKYLVNRGVAYFRNHQLMPAMIDFKNAIQLDSTNHLAYYHQSLIYLHHGQIEQSETIINILLNYNNQSICLDPSSWLLRSIIRLIKYQSKNSDHHDDDDEDQLLKEALNDIHQAEQLILPKLNDHLTCWPHLHYTKGQILYQLKKYKEAEEEFTKALSLLPSNKYFYEIRCKCREEMYRTGLSNSYENVLTDYRLSLLANDVTIQ
ncbi:putative o-linked n-acetylglucosamine transferase, ogt, partial [Schistosoma mansoni]|uniref:putative o-linked n-acetylglucosamine transferase, ogt n=1 Tax=Schistosoma mansoni TaxID=6183 RepID=UPI00022DC8AD